MSILLSEVYTYIIMCIYTVMYNNNTIINMRGISYAVKCIYSKYKSVYVYIYIYIVNKHARIYTYN